MVHCLQSFNFEGNFLFALVKGNLNQRIRVKKHCEKKFGKNFQIGIKEDHIFRQKKISGIASRQKKVEKSNYFKSFSLFRLAKFNFLI